MKKALFKVSHKKEHTKLKISHDEQNKLLNLFNNEEITKDFIEKFIEIISETSMSYKFVNECINNDIGLDYLSHLDLQDDLLLKIKKKNKYIEVEQTLLFRYYSIDDKTSYYSTKKINDSVFKKIIKRFDLSLETIEWGLQNLTPLSKSRYDYLKSIFKQENKEKNE